MQIVKQASGRLESRLNAYKTLSAVRMTHHDGADSQANLHLWREPPTSFSSECPLTVHPIQVIGVLQRSEARAEV